MLWYPWSHDIYMFYVSYIHGKMSVKFLQFGFCIFGLNIQCEFVFAFWILHIRFAYLVKYILDFGFRILDVAYWIQCDLVRINAQMMFKHDLGHLRLDPGLAWEFEKSVQTHILRGRALHCNHSRVQYMVKKSIQDSLAICKIQNPK